MTKDLLRDITKGITRVEVIDDKTAEAMEVLKKAGYKIIKEKQK